MFFAQCSVFVASAQLPECFALFGKKSVVVYTYNDFRNVELLTVAVKNAHLLCLWRIIPTMFLEQNSRRFTNDVTLRR